MTGKSNARSTIEFVIKEGLGKHADITEGNVRYAHIIVSDIIESIFHSPAVWAVRKYLKEIGEYETYAEKGE